MKIIGKTEKTFLVEATHEELLRTAGCHDMEEFVKQNGAKYVDQKSSYKWDWTFKIGATLDVVSTYNWVQKLRAQEKQILASADILGNLAEMLRQGIPSAIVPPPEQGSSGGD